MTQNLPLEMENSIVWAAANGDVALVKTFLLQSVTQDHLNEAFSCAVGYGHTEIADTLSSHGASFEAWDYDAVYWACHNGNETGIRYALSRGVDINVRDGMILSMCVCSMMPDFVRWLITQGAHVDANNGQALLNAVIYQRPENVLVLIENGAQTVLRGGEVMREVLKRKEPRMLNAILGLPFSGI